MIIVHAEHGIRDYDLWKAAFDRDPLHRERAGMHRYRIARAVNDSHYLLMDFEFEDLDAAEALCGAPRAVGLAHRCACPARHTTHPDCPVRGDGGVPAVALRSRQRHHPWLSGAVAVVGIVLAAPEALQQYTELKTTWIDRKSVV